MMLISFVHFIMEAVMFGDPFYGEIINYLGPRDIVNIINAHPNFSKISRRYFEESVKREIKRRFRNLFDDRYEEFERVMKENNAILAGSFVTQCALGSNWNVKIKIYLPNYPYNEILYHSCYSSVEKFLFYNMHLCTEELSAPIQEITSDDTTVATEAINIYMFYKSRSTIDKVKDFSYRDKFDYDEYIFNEEIDHDKPVIKLLRGDYSSNYIIEMIKNNDGFSICNNLFSFSNDELYLHNINDIITKSTKFKFVWDSLFDTRNSYKKYKSRGIQFVFDEDPEKIFNDAVSRNFIHVIKMKSLDQPELKYWYRMAKDDVEKLRNTPYSFKGIKIKKNRVFLSHKVIRNCNEDCLIKMLGLDYNHNHVGKYLLIVDE